VPQQTVNGHVVGPYSWGPNYWLVPTNGAAVDISSVELSAPPPASFQIRWQQLSQNGAETGQAPIWNGASWQPGWPTINSLPWSALTGIPSSFPATGHGSTHGNTGSDPVSLDASQIISGVFNAARIPAQSWASITGKPSAFAPSAHASSHASGANDPLALDASQITAGTFSVARMPQISYSSLSGIPSTFNASQLQGSAVDTAAPNDGNILTYNLTAAKWTPQPPSGALTGGIADQLALWKDGTSLQSSGLLVHRKLYDTYDVLNLASSSGSYVQWGMSQGFMPVTSLLEFHPDSNGLGSMSLVFYAANGSQQAKIYYDYDGHWKMTGFVNQIIRSTPNFGVGGSGSGSWNNWTLCSAGDGACNGIVTMVPYCRFFDPSTAPGGTLNFTLNWTDERNQPRSYSSVLDLSSTNNVAIGSVPAYVNGTSGVSFSAVFAGGSTASWRWQCDVKFN
jgi:hypothetical protein